MLESDVKGKNTLQLEKETELIRHRRWACPRFHVASEWVWHEIKGAMCQIMRQATGVGQHGRSQDFRTRGPYYHTFN